MNFNFEIFNLFSDGILVLDNDYRIAFANKGFYDLCRPDREDIVGRKCHEVSHNRPSACDTRVGCPYKDVFSGESLRVTNRHCMNGNKLLDVAASPIKDSKGNVIYLLEVLRDVTKNEELKSRLIESEEFLASVLEGIGEGVIVIDRDYRIISTNRGFCEQVNLPCGAITGRHCYEVSHHSSKPCYENGEKCSAREVFEAGQSRKVLHTHLSKEGRAEYIETVAYPIRDADGNISAVMEVLTDVTEKYERNQVEERLKFLTSISPATVYTCSSNGRCNITFISDNVTAMVGHEPHEFSDDPGFWLEHIHPADRERVMSDLSDLSRIGYQMHEYRFLHKDGTYRWIHDECRVSMNKDGMEIVGFWTDISGHKKLEGELLKKVRELEDFYRVAIDREMKMIELKKEIDRLNRALQGG